MNKQMIWNHIMIALPTESGYYLTRRYEEYNSYVCSPIYWNDDVKAWESWRNDNRILDVKEWAPETLHEYYAGCCDLADELCKDNV